MRPPRCHGSLTGRPKDRASTGVSPSPPQRAATPGTTACTRGRPGGPRSRAQQRRPPEYGRRQLLPQLLAFVSLWILSVRPRLLPFGGTQAARFFPTVRAFLNLPEILAEVDRVARQIGKPAASCPERLQDAPALDPLTGHSRQIIPLSADHSTARMTLLTNSPDVQHGHRVAKALNSFLTVPVPSFLTQS